METVTKLSWLVLALLHLPPALAVFFPSFLTKLYGVSTEGDMGVLLMHRGGLFLAVFIAALLATFMLDMRRLASLILAISILSFLLIYVCAEMPEGSLRKIAVADGIGLLPLMWVIWQSWFPAA